MSKRITPDSTQVKLWDEILKAIVDAMPEQLFPLFKEVYGKDYPKGTSITLLATESSTYQENPDAPPSSRLSDIALLVDGKDYYHLECQMANETDMVIRMIAYDLRLAMQYTVTGDEENDMLVMHFPRSTVIYPEKNKELPEFLRCRLIFQDKSEHIYQIPTVRIQSYSLQEIQKKHLMLFVPYVLLRLRPRLKIKGKHHLSKKELTAFVDEVMMILREEVEKGYLTEQEYDDYINLFRRASERIFKNYKDFRKEVDKMTKPLIELPSVLQKRLWNEIELLKDEKKLLENEKTSLMCENESLVYERESLVNEKKSLVCENESLVNEKKSLVCENESLVNENESLVCENESLVNEKKSLVCENESLACEKNSLKSKNDSLAVENETLLAVLAAKEKELVQLRELLGQGV